MLSTVNILLNTSKKVQLTEQRRAHTTVRLMNSSRSYCRRVQNWPQSPGVSERQFRVMLFLALRRNPTGSVRESSTEEACASLRA